jgi:hypothetical protein
VYLGIWSVAKEKKLKEIPFMFSIVVTLHIAPKKWKTQSDKVIKVNGNTQKLVKPQNKWNIKLYEKYSWLFKEYMKNTIDYAQYKMHPNIIS